jgi:hypothetical protein
MERPEVGVAEARRHWWNRHGERARGALRRSLVALGDELHPSPDDVYADIGARAPRRTAQRAS